MSLRRLLLLALLSAAHCEEATEEAPLPTPPPIDFLAQQLDFAAERPPTTLPPWLASKAQCDGLVTECIAWAACNGLLMRAAPIEGSPSPPIPAYVHAPFALGPFELPAECLEEAYAIGPLFGKLVEEVSRDLPWLSKTLATTAESDDFTKRLLRLSAKVASEGKVQLARCAILRSDYMLHEPEEGGESPRLLQVELNTIASSFAGLSQRISSLHLQLAQRYPLLRRHAWTEASKPATLSLPESLPPNPAAEGIAEGLAQAHALYGLEDAVVLFVVQPEERNHVDQEHVVQALWNKHGVRAIFRTLAQVVVRGETYGEELAACPPLLQP